MDIIKITGIPQLDLEILQKDQDERKEKESKENDKTKKSVQNSKRKMPRN